MRGEIHSTLSGLRIRSNDVFIEYAHSRDALYAIRESLQNVVSEMGCKAHGEKRLRPIKEIGKETFIVTHSGNTLCRGFLEKHFLLENFFVSQEPSVKLR